MLFLKNGKGYFGGYKSGMLSPVIVGKFIASSGPPLHAILPGVFNQTGGWRIPIRALHIIGKKVLSMTNSFRIKDNGERTCSTGKC
jgi:hypothetical protein